MYKSIYFSDNEISNKSENKKFKHNKKLDDTLKGLDILRKHIGKPIIITDACRYTGSKTSQHYVDAPFNALDIWVNGMSSIELMKVIEELNLFTGRGLYPFNNGFVHVDCRNGLYGNVVRWYRDKNGKYHTVNNFDNFY